MPQQDGSVVLRWLVMLLAVSTWIGIYAILSRLVSSPQGRFRLTTWFIAGTGFSFTIGWLIQVLVFGPAGYAAAERAVVEHVWLTSTMIVGMVLVCAGLGLAVWVRVEGRSLLATLLRPPTSVGHRMLGFKAYIALYALGWGVGALACGLPVVLGYV